MQEITCACGMTFIGEIWENGACPKCGKTYYWDIWEIGNYTDEDYDEQIIYLFDDDTKKKNSK